jgi:type VI secretion system protein ImpA
MAAGVQAAQAIAATLDQRLGASRSPDLVPLLKLMQCVAEAGQRTQAAALVGADVPAGAAAFAGSGVASDGLQTRDDAIRLLQRVSDWIERNEPSNPAPLLIQRAQRLMKKSFVDIIRDLVPEGLGQIEKLAGTGRE